ncbi:MAG: hypothetical protein JNM68_07610 [Dinghuibacter sp.]|nr:hypothetical protein [Dinghuibacter sp.]
MPVVELNIAVVAALVLVPAAIAWMIQVSRIKSLKGKILDHEYDMVKTHAFILELEKENARLKKETKPQQTAGVIDMAGKNNKVAAG